MTARITNEVLESYFNCKYKAYLQMMGHHGIKSEYETLLRAIRSEVKRMAIDRILAQTQEREVVSDVPLTASALRRGPLFILSATVQDDHSSLSLDGLKRVPGPSKLGQVLYVPILFHEGPRVRNEQRRLLEMHALLLSRYQGIVPGRGIVWHGRDCKATTLHLNPDLRKAKRVLEDLRRMCTAEEPPRLVLNDHCQVCEFRQRCHDQAVREDNLSLLRGMSEKEIRADSRKGVLTVTQLAHTFRPRRQGKRGTRSPNRRQHALQALALRDKRIYVLGTPQVPSTPVEIYMDVESDPLVGFVYLIGLIVVRNGSSYTRSFWADSKDEESRIFDEFVAEVTRDQDFLVFCYGSHERSFITRMRDAATSKTSVDNILERLVNILSVVYSHIYFPTYSNGLKDIGRCVGCSWTEPAASGIQSIVWRSRWEAEHAEEWKEKLQTYNLEDCSALKRVTEILRTISARTTTGDEPPPDNWDRPPIAFIEDVEKLTDYRRWGRINFVDPAYDYVNHCSYFDYQRERVYIRTGKSVRKSKSTRTGSPNRTVKASKRLVVVASRCPACDSSDVLSGVQKPIRTQEPRAKRAFDLVLTATGVRRVVIESRTSLHRCLTCGAEFVPYEHQGLDRHYHGLKSWAMLHHVAYRISLKTVSEMFEEFFGIRVFPAEIHMFKSLMADYYRETYRGLLQSILRGRLLHVDETEVNLQHGKGYVWVFTNLEEVVYMYRPTREGGFLRGLLQGFDGVLVSDFYNAYDSIECAQQKCLIHLMRDINQELLNNPFDEALKSITRPFGVLLRKIVSTVDDRGLRRHYLRRHEADVERFFASLTEQTNLSEAAEALRVRLIRYREKLFTFLKHDGVPWNNNNAEHAIKQFAYYRENTDGTMKETGLSDYLVLLSVCQTCQYKRLSFLRFLLSKERDVDVFRRTEHRRRPRSPVEVYPQGFVPPHLASHEKRKADRGLDETDTSDPQDSQVTCK